MKFRSVVSLAIVSKPIVVEAESFTKAEEAFRCISTEAVIANADSLGMIVAERVVRVPDSTPATPGTEAPAPKTDAVIEALKQNQENFERLMLTIGKPSSG